MELFEALVEAEREGGQHDEHGGHQVWGGDVSRARDGDQDDACPRPGAAREGDQWSAV